LEKVRLAANEWVLWSWLRLALRFFSGMEEFLVASGKDGLFFTGKFVSWGDVADGGVKPHVLLVFDEAR
jgi:hypothetical protein